MALSITHWAENQTYRAEMSNFWAENRSLLAYLNAWWAETSNNLAENGSGRNVDTPIDIPTLLPALNFVLIYNVIILNVLK